MKNLPGRRVSPGKLVWSTSLSHHISPHPLTRPLSSRRIRSLESHVADIRQTQVAIQSSLTEIVSHLRNGLGPTHRSPSVYQPPPFTPDLQSQDSPATATASTPTNPSHSHPPQLMVDTHTSSSHGPHQQQMVTPGQSSVISPPGSRPPLSAQQPSGSFHSIIGAPGHRPHAGQSIYPVARFAPISLIHSSSAGQHQNVTGGHHQGPVLPPFSSIEATGSSRSNVSSVRYQEETRQVGFRIPESAIGSKRPMPQSTVTSADSSDNEEEDNGELPASGLVAPWEVLRGLADVAVERASLENGDESQPVSRARTPDGDGRRSRPTKRRKVQHKPPRIVFQDGTLSLWPR